MILDTNHYSITNHLIGESFIPTVLRQGIKSSDERLVGLLAAAVKLSTFIPAGYKMAVKFFSDDILFFVGS